MLLAQTFWARIYLNTLLVPRPTCLWALCNVYAQIYMPMCSLPCLYLDLHVYVFFVTFMLKSTCSQAHCHVYAQIYMFMGSLPCLCLDLCLCVLCRIYAQIYMPMCSLPCLCLDLCVYVLYVMLVCLDLCWLLCHVLLYPLFSLYISLSCVLAFLVGHRSRSCGLGLHPYTQAYIKRFGSFPLHVYVCLLVSMLYLHVSLSRSRLYLTFHPQWACAHVVTSVPPRVCLDVITCEIHPCGVGVLNSCISLLCAMLICLPCLLCTTRLAFFASFHLCTLSYMFMHESVCRPYSNLMELQTFNPNLHYTPFCLIACLFALSYALHVFSPSFGIFSQFVFQHAFPSICFFAYLLACFFCLSLYTDGVRMLEARV